MAMFGSAITLPSRACWACPEARISTTSRRLSGLRLFLFRPATTRGKKGTMIIVLKANPTDAQVQEVEAAVRGFGYEPRTIRGVERTVVAAVGDERKHHTLESLTILPQVDEVIPIQKKYKLVSRESRKGDR